MNTLRIQQGNNIEVVTTNIIKKLYDVALSIPTPLEGETDPVYLSGNLQVDKTYATYVEYLTGRFPDLHINVTGAYYVIFEDPEVERILKTNISSDDVGVTTVDCENVTDFTTLGLSGNTSILTFDELKYFTNIKSLPQGCLSGTSNITKINLRNIESIGQGVFDSKTSLSDVVSSSNLRTIGNSAFKNCTSLTTITGLSNVTTLGSRVFYGCTALSGALDLSSLTSMNYECFYDAKSITSITSLGSITRISSGCFQGCKFTTIPILSNITRVDENAFAWCNSLSGITQANFPNLTVTEQKAFENSSISGHWDLTNITTVGNSMLAGTAITEVTIPDRLLNRNTFGCIGRCPDLTTIHANIPQMTELVYFYCTPSLQPFVIYQPLVTSTTGYIFESNSNAPNYTGWGNKPTVDFWTQMYYPNLTTTVSSYINGNGGGFANSVFYGGRSRCHLNLLYLKNVTSLDYVTLPAAGGYIDAFVINNTTVPKIYSHAQNDVVNLTEQYKFLGEESKDHRYYYTTPRKYHYIYVPDSAVSTYRAAWPDFSITDNNVALELIQPISNLNGGVIYATEADWTAAGKPVGLIAEYLGLSTADLASFVTANNLTYWTNPNA